MSAASDRDLIDQITRNCQIMVGALVAGVLVFLGVSVGRHGDRVSDRAG